KTFQRYSEHDSLFVADFYKGLMMFAARDSGYYRQFELFLAKADEQSYFDEVQIAKKLMPFDKVGFSFDDYQALAADKQMPEYYKCLIHQRAMRQFADSCEPFINYGLMHAKNKNYAIAAHFLAAVEQCGGKSQAEEWHLDYAYCLFMKGGDEKAVAYFNTLISSKNTFISQA